MAGEASEVIAKLREIEQHASAAAGELPKDSIAHSRLRHIGILATYARSKLESIKAAAQPTESAEQPTDKLQDPPG